MRHSGSPGPWARRSGSPPASRHPSRHQAGEYPAAGRGAGGGRLRGGHGHAAAGGDNVYITDRGFAVGTPAYMSPEQASAERDLDGRSDLYSLACVLYEMLAGQPPFVGSGARATMARHAIEPPVPIRSLRPTVPLAVELALQRALAKSPSERFATMAEFCDALVAPAPTAIPMTGPPTSVASPCCPSSTRAPIRRTSISATA